MPNNLRFWQLLLRPVSTWRRLVSERRAMHNQVLRLQDSEAFLFNLIQSIPDLIWLKNPDGVFLACNPPFERCFGVPQDRILGRTDYDFFSREAADGFRYHDQIAIEASQPVVNEEWITFAVGGQRMLVETTKVAMRSSTGELIGVLGIARDITERKRLEAELLEMATTDFLTGLSNRRHFIARMEAELARVNRQGSPVAVLMLDIDHFKRINDRYGHASGDAVLRQFADLIRAELRAVDSAGRVGGEEFAILLSGTDLAGAATFAERLRAKVARSPLAQGEQQIPVTVSIGITVLTADDANTSDVLHRADAALYEAKDGGRDRVAIAAAKS